MKVLVTGATGLIGSHLCRILGAGGHAIAILSRDPRAARNRLPGVVEAHTWDAESGPPPPEAFKGVDAVVHLAGEPINGRWTAGKKRRVRDSRVLGTRNVVKGIAAIERRPQVLVCASASGYYGDRGDEVLTEESAPGSGFLAELTQEWEAEANRATEYGLRVVSLRLGLVLGREGGALATLRPIFKLGAGGPLGSGRQWWPWVHVEDAAQVIAEACVSDWTRPVNVAAPEPVRQRELARSLGRRLSRPAIAPAPAFVLRLLLGEVATELLYSRRLAPERLQASGYAFRFPELEAALRDLLAG